MAMHTPVNGMALPIPARSPRRWLPARRMRPPAARKSRSFITAWFSTWASAPAVAAKVPRLRTRPISPIWAKVEYASMRLMSCCTRAITSPMTKVTAAMPVKSHSTHWPYPPSSGVLASADTTRATPNTPTLVSRPDSGADMEDGATGCAAGSQECSGKKPAFTVKPASTMSATPAAAAGL